MGSKQLGFSDYEITTAKKQTKRERFLSEMEVVVPWQALIDLIEPPLLQDQQEGRQASLSAGHHAAHPPVAVVVFAQRPRHERGPDRGAHHAPPNSCQIGPNQIHYIQLCCAP